MTYKQASEQSLQEFGIGSNTVYKAKEDELPDSPASQTPVKHVDDAGHIQFDPNYAGNATDTDGPLEEKYRALDYPNPAVLLAIHNKSIREKKTLLHRWQVELQEDLGASTKTANSKSPHKFALCAANGSGKDAFIVTPFVVWFAVAHVRALVIITSSSGVQLTAQTENYIRSLCQEINEYYGTTIFKINQRFIKCLLSGSEIRLFATDEAGKAEGYHPLEPDAKMCIVVNEAKSVAEDIMQALRRCTGYSHWLNVSTPGAPKGSFYKSFKNWAHKIRVDYSMCPHMSDEERLEDLRNEGEGSAYYRSKWLALFTSLDARCVIPLELINSLTENPIPISAQHWPDRIGIDLSAGGDEAGICHTKGNRIVKELFWRERDTTITTDKIENYLTSAKIPKTHEFIFADDGGLGHAIIDTLVRRGWNIKRIVNQSRAIQHTQYGNRGAELWDRVKRFFEERLFSPAGFSEKLTEQLTSRRYKELKGGKTYLESKKEAKAEGMPSPDRADAFVLSLVGLTIDDFLENAVKPTLVPKLPTFNSPEDMAAYYEENFRYNKKDPKSQAGRVLGSLAVATEHQNN